MARVEKFGFKTYCSYSIEQEATCKLQAWTKPAAAHRQLVPGAHQSQG